MDVNTLRGICTNYNGMEWNIMHLKEFELNWLPLISVEQVENPVNVQPMAFKTQEFFIDASIEVAARAAAKADEGTNAASESGRKLGGARSGAMRIS